MAIKLSELIGKIAKRSFEYEGETVNLEVFTQKVSPAYRTAWQQVEKDPDREARCQLTADMVKSWDVQQDDGEMQPVNYEFLRLCPDAFLNKLVEQIEDVVFGNPTSASSSPSGSQPTTTPQES